VGVAGREGAGEGELGRIECRWEHSMGQKYLCWHWVGAKPPAAKNWYTLFEDGIEVCILKGLSKVNHKEYQAFYTNTYKLL